MATLTTSVPTVIPRASAMPLRDLCRKAFVMLRLWRERARQRAALANLDDHLLRDIGVTRSQARYESDKPFWQ